jgi:hypothetical protein
MSKIEKRFPELHKLIVSAQEDTRLRRNFISNAVRLRKQQPELFSEDVSLKKGSIQITNKKRREIVVETNQRRALMELANFLLGRPRKGSVPRPVLSYMFAYKVQLGYAFPDTALWLWAGFPVSLASLIKKNPVIEALNEMEKRHIQEIQTLFSKLRLTKQRLDY